MLLQFPSVRFGGVCEGVQHLHRGVYPRPAGTHRPGDRCAAQALQPPAGTFTSLPSLLTAVEIVQLYHSQVEALLTHPEEDFFLLKAPQF